MAGLAEGTIVDGRYTLKHRIGSGGMADVYCAQDLQLGRKVAIKLLYARFAEDEEFVERFRREASSAAGLQHQNVVSVYDRGEYDDTAYIAMEFVDGRTLKEIILQEGPLEPGRAIDIVVQVLRAAKFAHKRGIIHRDLKPHNVIVDAEDRAKVTDFGIAKAGASDMTQTGSIMGTAQYLSPEQAQGHPVSAQADLYSVGIMLFEALTGAVPFDGDAAVTIALKQVSERPGAPSARNPAVSHELDQVVLRALEKEPARRFADADEMIAALEHAQLVYRNGTTALLPNLATGAHAVSDPSLTTLGGWEGAPGTADPPSESYAYPAAPYGPVTGSHYVAAPVDPDEERSRRRWIIGGAIALLAVVAILLAVVLLSPEDDVSVATVVGRTQAQAEQTLRQQGFSTDVRTRTDQAVSGQVIAQDPAPPAKAEKGSTVTLTISTGPGTVPVPEVARLPRSQARSTLEGAGFKVVERRERSDDVTTGRVISTSPAAGQPLERGQAVTVVVSSGPDRSEVPSVVGQPLAAATTAMEDAGFEVTSSEQESADSDPGTVLSQDPASGATAADGSTVALVVATAPKQVAVPSVVGSTVRTAVRELSGAGFEVAQRERETDDPDEDGQVLAQSPAGGAEVQPGGTVNITVGRYEEPDPTPTVPTVPTTPTTPTTPGGTTGP